MISIDTYVLDFVGSNWITLYLLITLLKGAALMTKSTKDDRIVTLLSNAYGVVRKRKLPDELPGIESGSTASKTTGVEEVPQTSDTIR